MNALPILERRRGWFWGVAVTARTIAVFMMQFAETDGDESKADRWIVPIAKASSEAKGGRQLAADWDLLSLEDREQQAESEIRSGNVPHHWKEFVPIRTTATVDGKDQNLTFFAAPDYLAVGNSDDFLRIPISPAAAQRVADQLRCILPTPQMVDQIYAGASIVLEPQPMAPTAEMTRLSYFAKHNRAINHQVAEKFPNRQPGQLLAGHKKDVVLTLRLAKSPGRVAIYGWHQQKGRPIQPLYVGHVDTWVDYSHGIRLIAREGFLHGIPCDLREIMANEKLHVLLSNEGPLHSATYAPPPSPAQSSSTKVITTVEGETTEFLQ